MPIYEYRCRACGKAFDHLHRRLNEPAPACPACGAKRPVKQLSSFSPKVGGSASERLPCSSGSCCSRHCPAAGSCSVA